MTAPETGEVSEAKQEMKMDKRELIVRIQELTDDASDLPPMDIAVILLVAIGEQIRRHSPNNTAAVTHNAEQMAKHLIAIANRPTARG